MIKPRVQPFLGMLALTVIKLPVGNPIVEITSRLSRGDGRQVLPMAWFTRFISMPVLWAVDPGTGPTQGIKPRSAEGDPDDLHKLVVEHGDAVYRLARSIVRDASLAEDVAQDTLVKAWLALPSFRGDASLRSWVLRIAHNTAISTLRARRATVMDPTEMPETENVPERSVESRVESSEVMDAFVKALDHLDELSRSIVVLRELEGLSYDEISTVLNVPLPTVKTRLLRGRRRLGSVLREWS